MLIISELLSSLCPTCHASAILYETAHDFQTYRMTEWIFLSVRQNVLSVIITRYPENEVDRLIIKLRNLVVNIKINKLS
jgi:hypothetical protein